MPLTPHTDTEPPASATIAVLRPRATAWACRVWRHSPAAGVHLFRIDASLDPAEVEDKALGDALRPFAAQLQKFAIYVLHPEETKRLAPWAVGRLDVDEKSAYVFLHDYAAAPNGMLMLNLMQAPGATIELIMGVVPVVVEDKRMLFAIPDYDFGVRGSIG